MTGLRRGLLMELELTNHLYQSVAPDVRKWFLEINARLAVGREWKEAYKERDRQLAAADAESFEAASKVRTTLPHPGPLPLGEGELKGKATAMEPASDPQPGVVTATPYLKAASAQLMGREFWDVLQPGDPRLNAELFETRERFRGCPPICHKENLPAFLDEAELFRYHNQYGDSPAVITRKGKCKTCQCWHYTTGGKHK